MSNRATVRIENQRDRWRFTCPNGHRSWEPTNDHFYCQQCYKLGGVEPAFEQLRDRKTGRLLHRTEVQLLTEAGPYDRDLDRRGRK